MPKCDFNKVRLQHGCSPVNLLHIFRTPFPKNTFGYLLVLLCLICSDFALYFAFLKFDEIAFSKTYFYRSRCTYTTFAIIRLLFEL